MHLHKYLISLQVFLVILHGICAEESVTSAILSEERNKESAVADSNIDYSTINPETEDEGNYPPIILNTNQDQSESDLLPLLDDKKNASNKLRQETVDELEDLRHGGIFENIPKTIGEDDVIDLPVPIDNDQQGPTSDIEWIEEDEGEEDPDLPPVVQAMVDVSEDGNAAVQGQMGIMVALFLVVFLVTGYMGFVIWRRFIERRYESREILINEEDMVDPNDMKHFSL